MIWPATYGPAVTIVFTIDTSTEAAAVPPLPVLSVLFAVFGSNSAGVAVAVLSKAPAAVIVALTFIVVFAPRGSEGNPAGRPAPGPEALPRVLVDGVSATSIDVAVRGPAV